MPSFSNPATEQHYLALVRAFPLVSIRDDAHLADALAVIDRLIEKPERSEAEEVYLGALTDLVETYEHAHVAIPPVSGVDALRYLMEENGLTQADLAPLFGSPSIVSEVLSGKRRLALRISRSWRRTSACRRMCSLCRILSHRWPAPLARWRGICRGTRCAISHGKIVTWNRSSSDRGVRFAACYTAPQQRTPLS